MPVNPLSGLEEEELVVPQALPEMNPIVKEHLMKKFNLGDYSNENRAKLAEDSKIGFGDRAGAALAAIGAGFMGQNPSSAGLGKLEAARAEKRQALDDFDRGRANKIQEYSLDRQFKKDSEEDELSARESDVNSQESKLADELARSMGYNGPPLTAKQFKGDSPMRAKIFELKQRDLDRKEARDERRYQSGIRREDKQALLDEKRQNKDLALAVPGYNRTGEVLPKEEEAVKFRKATAVSKQLQLKLDRMKQLVKENGSFEYGGTGGQEMESLATEIQLLGKSPELYELGVLAGPDLSLLEKITADPSSLSSLFTLDSTRQKQLDSQIKSIQEKLGATASSLGYVSEASPQEGDSVARRKRIEELRAKKNSSVAGK